MAVDPMLRVSIAALCRVIFPHPQTGQLLLALERRDFRANQTVVIRAQPFGGALRILNAEGLHAAVGDFVYDSPRSSEEQDLRILIRPDAWEALRGFILAQLQSPQADVIETDPRRELEEEFLESVGVELLPEHYTYRPLGISVQDKPRPTANTRSPGALTVRIYRVFEVILQDEKICAAVLEKSQRFTDEDLQVLAQVDAARGGNQHVNSALVMPLDEVRAAIHGTSHKEDGQVLIVQGHRLDATVAALFPESRK